MKEGVISNKSTKDLGMAGPTKSDAELRMTTYSELFIRPKSQKDIKIQVVPDKENNELLLPKDNMFLTGFPLVLLSFLFAVVCYPMVLDRLVVSAVY